MQQAAQLYVQASRCVAWVERRRFGADEDFDRSVLKRARRGLTTQRCYAHGKEQRKPANSSHTRQTAVCIASVCRAISTTCVNDMEFPANPLARIARAGLVVTFHFNESRFRTLEHLPIRVGVQPGT